MTLHLVFTTITVTFSKNKRTLTQELDARRKREIIEENDYKKSFHFHC